MPTWEECPQERIWVTSRCHSVDLRDYGRQSSGPIPGPPATKTWCLYSGSRIAYHISTNRNQKILRCINAPRLFATRHRHTRIVTRIQVVSSPSPPSIHPEILRYIGLPLNQSLAPTKIYTLQSPILTTHTRCAPKDAIRIILTLDTQQPLIIISPKRMWQIRLIDIRLIEITAQVWRQFSQSGHPRIRQ